MFTQDRPRNNKKRVNKIKLLQTVQRSLKFNKKQL